MKIKYKEFEGELIPTPKGYYTTDRSGDIIFPEFIFICQNHKQEIYALPVTAFGDLEGELHIWENGDLYNKMYYGHFKEYVEFEIKECYGQEKGITGRILDRIQEAEMRGVYISIYVKEFIEKKEYLKLIDEYNEKNRN